jgi:hypothetical protein
MDIRKISVGPDYKGGAMHYLVGQKILGESNEIHRIRYNNDRQSIQIFIINKKEEVVLWKEFTQSIPISIEFNIDF